MNKEDIDATLQKCRDFGDHLRHREMTRMIREILGPDRAYEWWFSENNFRGSETQAIEPIIFVRAAPEFEDLLYSFIRTAYEEYRARVLL